MSKYSFNVFNILDSLHIKYKVKGDIKKKHFSSISPIDQAEEKSIVFISQEESNWENYVNKTKATIILCSEKLTIKSFWLKTHLFILVSNPKWVFAQIVKKRNGIKKLAGIDKTSIINAAIVIPNSTYIGPFCNIGKCHIGTNVTIEGNCFIYDNVYIGKGVKIGAGCVIGGEGFGFIRKNNIIERFPQIGKVVIENDVEIGANVCIDRGSLGKTIIKKGTKIDNLVHIAHNVTIGKHTMIVAQSLIAGSTVIGDNCFIGAQVVVRDKVKIGNNVFIGMGSVVTKNISDNQTFVGIPARPLKEFLTIQKKLINL